MPHMTSVSVGLWFAIGSRYEPEALNGICHFIEHLLFKGTRKRTAKEISEAVEGIGGYLNAFTSEESTCFHARASHERFEELVDVLMDMALESKFQRTDVDKEREVIKEEIAMYLDQPQHQVQELLNGTLWPGQPLGRPITGTPGTLDRMSRVEVRGYQDRHYIANKALMVVAGRVRHQQVVRTMRRYYKRMNSGVPEALIPAQNGQAEPRICLFTKETEQTQLALGVRTCSRHDERRYALRLLNTMLGENMSSRLFQVIREDRGLAYSIYSSPSFFEDTGDLVISAGLDTGNVTQTLGLIMKELRRFKESPPPPAELKRARDYLMGQMDLSLEGTDNQMNWIGEQWVGYGKIMPPEEVKRRFRQVTGREVQGVAKEFFCAERLNLALVSPLKSAGRWKGLLEKCN